MANYPTSNPNLKTTFTNVSPHADSLLEEGLNKPNREVNAMATEIGNNPKAAALEARASSASAVTNLLGQLKQGIKDILGTTNWYDAAGTTIATLWGKFNDTSGHKHTAGSNDAPQIPAGGIATDAVTTAKILDSNVTAAKISGGAVDDTKLATNAVTTVKVAANAITKGTQVFSVIGVTTQSIAAAGGMTQVTNATGTLVTTGGDLLINLNLSSFHDAGALVNARLAFTGGTYWPNGTGYPLFYNTVNTHQGWTFSGILTGLAAGTYTVALQMSTAGGNVKNDLNDQFILTVVELKK